MALEHMSEGGVDVVCSCSNHVWRQSCRLLGRRGRLLLPTVKARILGTLQRHWVEVHGICRPTGILQHDPLLFRMTCANSALTADKSGWSLDGLAVLHENVVYPTTNTLMGPATVHGCTQQHGNVTHLQLSSLGKMAIHQKSLPQRTSRNLPSRVQGHDRPVLQSSKCAELGKTRTKTDPFCQPLLKLHVCIYDQRSTLSDATLCGYKDHL